jgi:hypothetical protein
LDLELLVYLINLSNRLILVHLGDLVVLEALEDL